MDLTTGPTKNVCRVVAEDKYLPKHKNSAVSDLFVKIIPSLVGGLSTGNSVTLNHRTVMKFDMGVKIHVPDGFKLCVGLNDTLGNQGLVMTNSPQVNSLDSIQITVCNIGRDLVRITDGDKFAECWLEEIHQMEWVPVQETIAAETT